MSNYTYLCEFTLIPSLASQFEKSFAKIIYAHSHHQRGLGKHMKFTRTFAGGKDVITLIVPMSTLGFMDTWMHTPEIVIEYYGKDEGIKILQDYCDATVIWESKIVKTYNALEYYENA